MMKYYEPGTRHLGYKMMRIGYIVVGLWMIVIGAWVIIRKTARQSFPEKDFRALAQHPAKAEDH